MLVLTLSSMQTVVISTPGGEIRIEQTASGNRRKLCIDAPKDYKVSREDRRIREDRATVLEQDEAAASVYVQVAAAAAACYRVCNGLRGYGLTVDVKSEMINLRTDLNALDRKLSEAINPGSVRNDRNRIMNR